MIPRTRETLRRLLPARSVEANAIAYPHRSRHLDHGVHTDARKLPYFADLNPVVPSERPEDIGVLG